MSRSRSAAPEPSQHEVRFSSPLPVRTTFRGAAREIQWSAESLDLVDVAAAVFIADRSVRRRLNRPRRVRLRVPVRRPSLWRELAPERQQLIEPLVTAAPMPVMAADDGCAASTGLSWFFCQERSRLERCATREEADPPCPSVIPVSPPR